MPTYHVHRTALNADETTPVALFRLLRAYFSPAVLLESHNFEQRRDSRSIIGVDALVELRFASGVLTRTDYGTSEETTTAPGKSEVFAAFRREIEAVAYVGDPGPVDGFFGFTSFDAYRFAEPELRDAGAHAVLPDLHYYLFRFLLVFDHFHERIDVVEFAPEGEASELPQLLALLRQGAPPEGSFAAEGEETTTMTDAAYEEMVAAGMRHCALGDTFQVVLSRGHAQAYRGDDFEFYRELRRLNPSPYLFYFDFGAYRIIGASPEALLTVRDGRAIVKPIAGTAPRTGDAAEDAAAATRLLADPKENAEHRMLVDLARNDLTRSCYPVRVDKLRTIEYYSHLMHIVSEVSGEIERGRHPYEIYTEVFPAGTLSGAPKFKAVELIYRYEGAARGAYGGGLGYVSPRGAFDHCILIRTAVSYGNALYFRAGGGIVAASTPAGERAEVRHKTNAIRRAIHLATAAPS